MRPGTPYVAIAIAAVIAFGLAIPHDLEFLAGVFAFGAMITFAIAHLSVIALRFREPDRPSAFRVPLSIVTVRGGRVPLPAVFGRSARGRCLDQRDRAARGRPRDRRRSGWSPAC